jgi:chromosome partitioning protein
MRTIAIANQKGGSGKTTTCVNLAAALGELERRVLLIDLDPQYSASTWLKVTNVDKGIFAVLVENGNLIDNITQTDVAGVAVVPSSPWLVGAEKALATEVGAENLLARALMTLPAGAWDYILIDCPPTLGVLTVNALTAARELLIPVETHVMALQGLAQLLHTVDLVKARLNPELTLCSIVPCRVDLRTRHAQEIIEQLHVRFGNLVSNVPIRANVRLAEAPSFGQPITQYDPKSTGAADYRALARTMLTQERSRSHAEASHHRQQSARRTHTT